MHSRGEVAVMGLKTVDLDYWAKQGTEDEPIGVEMNVGAPGIIDRPSMVEKRRNPEGQW
jgi:hypothetical protein